MLQLDKAFLGNHWLDRNVRWYMYPPTIFFTLQYIRGAPLLCFFFVNILNPLAFPTNNRGQSRVYNPFYPFFALRKGTTGSGSFFFGLGAGFTLIIGMVHVITPPPTDVSTNDIIWLAGPRLIGILFNWSLLGVLTTQVYIYYLNFPKDPRWNKVLVCTVYLLDWAQTCSATYDVFHWFVYGWGSIDALYDLWSTFLNVPILSSIVAAIVQMYFGWRIWKLTHSRIIFSLIGVLALLQLGGGIAVGIFLWRDSSEVARSDGLVSSVGVRLAGSAFADTVIAISMTYFLIRSKSQIVGHMNNVVTRLIRLTIETGTVTAIAAIVDLVFFLKATNGLHQVSGVILCKLYSNSLLVLFNNRMIIASSKQNQTHFLSGNSGSSSGNTMPSEGESSRELETFKAAVPRLSTLDLDGEMSMSSKGGWRSRSQVESIPLDDFTRR